MSQYFQNIYDGIKTLISGMSISYQHFQKRKDLNATLQYPHEKWPIPERNIGHSNEDYNLIRSRLHVDIDDCIYQAMLIKKDIINNTFSNNIPGEEYSFEKRT